MNRSVNVMEPGTPAPERPVAGDRRPQAAWTLARLVLTVVFCTSCLVALLEVWQAYGSVSKTVVAAVLMGALLTIVLAHFSRPGTELRSPRGYALLVALALLAFLPLPFYGLTWVSLPPFLAGCVLLVLPPAAAWTAFTVIIGSLMWIRFGLGETGLTLAYYTFNETFFGLTVYLLTRLAGTVAELHSARDELAKLAVAEERLRFARDLHDLLGLSLSAITLKGELTHRLLVRYPLKAKQELAEILDIARRALADVRAVASGYRELSLDQEARSAESVLRASEVDVAMDLDYGDLPARVRTILGMVLREGVTNVLRHSKAEHCDIAIHRTGGVATLELLNDGVVVEEPRDPDAGSGLSNLSARAAAMGGEVAAGLQPDGRFRLSARLPLAQPKRDTDTTAAPQRSMSAPMPLDARLLTVLVAVTFSLVALTSFLHVAELTLNPLTNLIADAGLLTVLLLQLCYFSRPHTRLRSRTGYLMLAVQACVIYLPLLALGKDWVSLPGWLGGNALLVAPPVFGWTVFAGTMASEIWTQALSSGEAINIVYFGAGIIVTGIAAYGLTSLVRSVAELQTARRELATAAVAEERLRFARDLHDLLGLSLSAITLKCELTNRLLVAAPAQAGDELTEILALSRQALSDVRSVAGGYRELPFDKESESAQSVLTAADVQVRMDLDYDELPVRVRTVLAVVLREGVTNVLRHSKARQCDIVLRQAGDAVTLAIVNDGVLEQNGMSTTGAPSSGIRNLSERVAKLGGELDCGPADVEGSYRLRVNLPI